MGKLLVIGGSGFFGKSILQSYVAGDLRQHGIEAIALISRHASILRSTLPRSAETRVEFFDSDIRNLTTLLDADIVIHGAASSNTRRYRDDPNGERSIIVDGTKRILELARRAERVVRVLYVSSGAVYGPQPAGVTALAESSPFSNEPDQTKRVYMDAKRTAEDLVASASQKEKIVTSIARCFAFVGPALPFDQHFAIGNFIGDALKKRQIVVVSANRVVRSYMFADDLVEWLLAVAKSSSTDCPIFNVGSDVPVCIRDLATLIGELAGVGVSLPKLEASGTVNRYVPSTVLARTKLGLTMRFSLRNAIEETIQRCLAQARAPTWQELCKT